MNLFLPITQGEYPLSVSHNFLSAFSERIRTGLFPMAKSHRNAYEVVTQETGALRFRSTNMLSGINVGMNDVRVLVDKATGRARFEIRYWTWARYAIALCLSMFVCGLLAVTVGRVVFPPAWFADVDRFPAMAWGMLLFWGLMWPWILIEIHKPNVRKCLIRIMDEVNESHAAK